MDDNQSQTEENKPIFRRLYERVFPTVADFFGMLAEQARTLPKRPACSSNSWKPATYGHQPEGP
ncbi:MAG: hypothetical protein V5B38_18655 [Candidatus Accumulibacter propinquus]